MSLPSSPSPSVSPHSSVHLLFPTLSSFIPKIKYKVLMIYSRAPSEFLCKMQFRNNLPDIPFDPKLLALPHDSLRYTKCIIGSSLESSSKHSIFTEPDLGIPIHLIDTNIYKVYLFTFNNPTSIVLHRLLPSFLYLDPH